MKSVKQRTSEQLRRFVFNVKCVYTKARVMYLQLVIPLNPPQASKAVTLLLFLNYYHNLPHAHHRHSTGTPMLFLVSSRKPPPPIYYLKCYNHWKYCTVVEHQYYKMAHYGAHIDIFLFTHFYTTFNHTSNINSLRVLI